MGALADQPARRRVHPLALLREHPRHRVLSEPVDLKARVPGPQLGGDGQVAPDVAEPDRRADVQRPFAAVPAPGPGLPRRRPWAAQRRGEVADQQVGPDRIAHRRAMPAAVDRHQPAAGPAGQRHAGVVGHDPVFVAVHDQDRAAHLPAGGLGVRRGDAGRGRKGQQQRLGGGLQAPAHAVLTLLDRVRLGEHLRHEELDPAPVVRQPVVPVRLPPALVAVLGLIEVRWGRPGQRRPERDHPGRPLRMPGGQLERVPAAQRQADEHGLVHPGRVQRRDRVVRVLPVAVGRRGRRPTGVPVAAALDGDHAEMPRQVRHLGLPLPRVHDRPRREQQDRRLSGAVDRVADAHPVPLDDAVIVGFACPHCTTIRAGQPRAPWIAVQIFSGVSGMSRCLMPYGRSASMTALTRAGSTPIVPLSPMPLTPSGLAGDGVHSR